MARYQPKSKTLRSSTETKVGLVVLGFLALLVSISLYIRVNQLAASNPSGEHTSKLDLRVPEPVVASQISHQQEIEKPSPKPESVTLPTTIPESTTENEITATVEEIPAEPIQLEPEGDVYTMTAGESLHDIARTKLGNACYWVQIYQENQQQLESGGQVSTEAIELVLPQDARDNDMIECALHNRQLLLQRR